jgi:hypothetical protein
VQAPIAAGLPQWAHAIRAMPWIRTDVGGHDFFFNPKPKMKNMGTPGFEPGGFRDSGHGRLS